jgi:acyl carrier protein
VFLDAFAQRHARGGRRLVAIDWCEWQWDAWTRSLLPVDPEIRRRLDHQREVYGLSFEEGLEALCRAVSSGFSRLVVSTRDFAEVKEQRRSISRILDGLERFRRESQSPHQRPVLGTPYVAPRTDLERMLAAIWQELLGIEEVGMEDNFLQLGGHSLLALQVISRVHETLQIDLPLHALLATPTIAELASVIAGLELSGPSEPLELLEPSLYDGGAGTSWKDEDVLHNLDKLSEEQLDGLLAEILDERNGERP